MTMKRFVKYLLRICLRRFSFLFPIQKNKVVLANFHGGGYGDSPKYIAEEILRQNLPWRLVWLADKFAFVPSNIKRVNYYGFAAFFELSTARIIISNCKNNVTPFYKKKKGQFYLQTWHGDFKL